MHYGMCTERPPVLPSLSSLLTLRFKMLLVGWGRSALRANALPPTLPPANILEELNYDDDEVVVPAAPPPPEVEDEDEDEDDSAVIMALVIFVQLY